MGSGPRLRPLQQAWDAQASAASRAAAEDTTARWYAEVAAVTTAEQRAELLRADEVKFGRRAEDPVAALAAAGRRVARLFPEMALTAALARWAEDILADHEPETVVAEQVPNATSLSTDLLMDAGDQRRMQLRGVRLGPRHSPPRAAAQSDVDCLRAVLAAHRRRTGRARRR